MAFGPFCSETGKDVDHFGLKQGMVCAVWSALGCYSYIEETDVMDMK